MLKHSFFNCSQGNTNKISKTLGEHLNKIERTREISGNLVFPSKAHSKFSITLSRVSSTLTNTNQTFTVYRNN